MTDARIRRVTVIADVPIPMNGKIYIRLIRSAYKSYIIFVSHFGDGNFFAVIYVINGRYPRCIRVPHERMR